MDTDTDAAVGEQDLKVSSPSAPADDDEDWCVPCSDDDEEDGEKKSVWEPEPKQIIELYNKLCKDQIIELEWKNPGRRPPEREQEKLQVEDSNELEEEEAKEEEVTEFDFDTIEPEPTITPRRTPATAKTPRTHRVARMDKILDDIFKQKLDSLSKADTKSPKSPRSPRGGAGPSTGVPAGDSTPKRPPEDPREDDPFGF